MGSSEGGWWRCPWHCHGREGPRIRNCRSGGESWLLHPQKAKDEQGPGLEGHSGEWWDSSQLQNPEFIFSLNPVAASPSEPFKCPCPRSWGGKSTEIFICLELPRKGCWAWHSQEKVDRPRGFHSKLWISKIWDFRRCFCSKPQRVDW